MNRVPQNRANRCFEQILSCVQSKEAQQMLRCKCVELILGGSFPGWLVVRTFFSLRGGHPGCITTHMLFKYTWFHLYTSIYFHIYLYTYIHTPMHTLVLPYKMCVYMHVDVCVVCTYTHPCPDSAHINVNIRIRNG